MDFESVEFDQLAEKLATDYTQFVVQILQRMPQNPQSIDQDILQRTIALAASFLLCDTTTNPTKGASTWATGFSNLIDLVVALHYKGELRLETMNAASKACSECWGVAGTWRNLHECREVVRKVAQKLKRILDANGRTYGGQRVYAP